MKRDRFAPRTLHKAALALSLLAIGGCGQTAAPQSADEELARRTLDQALTAWQQGESVESVKQTSPSIRISDPSWERGDALKKFEVASQGKPSGAEREYTVNLWLADSKGKEKRTEVVYRVGTHPIFTVFRAMF